MFELKGMDNSEDFVLHFQSTLQKDAVICGTPSYVSFNMILCL